MMTDEDYGNRREEHAGDESPPSDPARGLESEQSGSGGMRLRAMSKRRLMVFGASGLALLLVGALLGSPIRAGMHAVWSAMSGTH
jgi:hypothetical protein